MLIVINDIESISAMITKDKVTELSRMVDDFCKFSI